MNKTLIKEVIKYKLHAAELLVDCLPPETSKHIKNLSRLILDGANEHCQSGSNTSVTKTKSKEKLNSIMID